MVSSFEKAKTEMKDLIRLRRPVDAICSCLSGPLSAVLEVSQEHSRDSYGVMVRVSFAGIEHGADFKALGVPEWSCEGGCVTSTSYLLHMPLWVWNQYFKNKTPLTAYFVGLIHVDWQELKYLNMSQPLGYFVLPKEMKSNPDTPLMFRYAEMFTGGFSGWSQAANILAEFCWEIEFMWGIELDADAAKMFKLSFKDVYVAQTFGQAVEQYMVDSGNDSSSPFLFQCDVVEGWWMQFVQVTHLDLLVMSPPCQPWSFPNASSLTTGLLSKDGLVMIEALVKGFELGATTIALESVATLSEHPHWKIILAVVQAYGYEVAWSKTLDLADMIPQHRRRFLIVFVHSLWWEKNQAMDVPIVGESWPDLQRPTIGSYGVILPLDGFWAPLVALTDVERMLFMDPNLLPMAKGIKRTKVDVNTYRLRSPSDVFSCIMASYTQQVHFDIDILRAHGLYGGLLKITDEPLTFRYLSAPEGLILMGLCQNLVIPADRRLHWKLIGNAIATPHALIAMWNAARFLSGIHGPTPTSVQVFERMLATTFRNSNTVWRSCPDGIMVEHNSTIEPTQHFEPVQVPQFQKLIIVCGKWRCMVQHQYQIHPKEVLKLLNADFNDGYDLSKLPHATTWADEVLQQVTVPFELNLSHLQAEDFDSQCVILMTCMGIFVAVRCPHAYVNGIGFMALNDSIGTAPGYTCPTNSAGLAIAFNDPLPQVIFVNDGHPLDGVYRRCLSLMDFAPVGDFDEKFICYLDLDDAMDLYNFFLRTKLEAAIVAVGWSLGLVLKESFLKDNTGAGPAHLLLQPEKSVLAMSANHFRVFMIMRIAHWSAPRPYHLTEEMVAQKIDDTDIPYYVMVKVKFQDDTIWRGNVPSLGKIGEWAKSVMESAHKFHDFVQVRTVIHGKNRDPSLPLKDFWKNGSQEIKIFLVTSLQGGGSKEGLQVVAKNKIATHLLSQGAKLEDVSDFVLKVVQTVGHSRVLQTFEGDNFQKISNGIHEFAKIAGLSLPAITVKEAAQARVSGAIKRKGIQKQVDLAADMFSLADGFFSNDDGSPAAILPVFSTKESGVALMDFEPSQEWINATPIVPDELAIVVLGTSHSFSHGGGKVISFPAFDRHGQPMVLNGVIYQLGEKHVKVNDRNRTSIKGTDNVVVSFSMYSDEFAPQQWSSVTSAPVRHAQLQWSQDGLKDVMITSPWNRTWKNNKNVSVAPSSADVVTFFARVSKSNIEKLLKISGENHVYAFPRSEQGQPPDWMAIWIPQSSRAEVLKMAARSSYFRGLIRSPKAFGIRVHKEDFDAAWKEFKPQTPVPDRRHMPHLVKVKPFPHGTTHDDITKWLVALKMEARPLKSLGPDAWLLAMAVKPSDAHADYNGHVVLLKVIDKQKTQSPVVLAGSVQSAPKNSDNDDPWKDWQDPWSERIPMALKQKPSSTASSNRNVEAPIAARFQQYEEQLDAMKMSITTMRDDFHATKKAQQKDIACVQGRLDNMDANLSTSLQTLASTFEQSLATALSTQDKQMQQGFQDLKAMLEAASKVPSPARHRQKTQHDV